MCDLCTAYYKDLQVFVCHECGVKYIPQGEIEKTLESFLGWVCYTHNQRYLCPICLKKFEETDEKYYISKEQLERNKKFFEYRTRLLDELYD